MKKFIVFAALVGIAMLSYVTPAFADGCYICQGGSYVKYTGDDNQDKRKAAKACGCEIGGTRGDCSAANLKVLCTVQNELNANEKLACAKDKNKSEETDETAN